MRHSRAWNAVVLLLLCTAAAVMTFGYLWKSDRKQNREGGKIMADALPKSKSVIQRAPVASTAGFPTEACDSNLSQISAGSGQSGQRPRLSAGPHLWEQ